MFERVAHIHTHRGYYVVCEEGQAPQEGRLLALTFKDALQEAAMEGFTHAIAGSSVGQYTATIFGQWPPTPIYPY